MEVADGPASARRALGRFHVELSAGAQSMRLTRAGLAMHEEFDWLVQVLLDEDRHRAAAAEAMRAVAGAVAAGEAMAAWRAGERMVAYLLTELMRARLHRIAACYAQPRRGQGGIGDLASEVRLIADTTIEQLESMGRQVARAFDPVPSVRKLKIDLAQSVLPALGQVEEIIHGFGFMAEVGVLPEARYWLEWWQRSVDGAFDRDYSHQLDPTRDDFYDYGSKAYMTRPRATGEPSAMGPYIDHGGVDDYLVTIGVPVMSHDVFVGIMAADIRVAHLERAVSSWLAQADGACVLLNAESRVLLSNSVRYHVGDVLSADANLSFMQVGRFGWVIGQSASSFEEHS